MKFLIVLISTVTITMAVPTQLSSHYGYHGPPAPIGHDGRVVDTPEVAHAKAVHFAAYADATSKASYSVPYIADNSVHKYQEAGTHSVPVAQPTDIHGFSHPTLYSARMYHENYGYHGPAAPLDHKGRVVDTPEVAKAKAAHFAAYNHIASNAAHAPLVASENYSKYNSGNHGYHGPPAPLSHDGRVIDTPEVAHAKAAHLAAYSNAAHGQPYNSYDNY